MSMTSAGVARGELAAAMSVAASVKVAVHLVKRGIVHKPE